MDDLLVLIPLLPLAAAVINFVLGRWYIKDNAGYIAVLGVAGAWLVSLLAFIDQLGSDEPLTQHLYTWIPAGSFNVPLNLLRRPSLSGHADGRDERLDPGPHLCRSAT